MLDKIKSWCRRSLTIAWAYALVAGGTVIEAAPTVLEVLNFPEVASAFGAFHWAGAYTAAIGVVTFLVRLRLLRRA